MKLEVIDLKSYMYNIIYTILLFNILIIVFKMFEKYKVDNLQGLIFNYITAGSCAYFFLEQDFSLEEIINSAWLYHAIIIGTLFIVVFNFYAYGIQKVGIAITTVANKMSLIIPVSIAILLYGDTFKKLKQKKIRNDLTIKPFVMGAPMKNNQKTFPVYRESSNKFYVPIIMELKSLESLNKKKYQKELI